MTGSSFISVGPLNIPRVVLPAAAVYLIIWIIGRIILRNRKEDFALFSGILSSPLLPFLLGWKLSLLITDFGDILKTPLLILYSSGGGINLFAGIFCGIFWMGWRWKQAKPSKKVNQALGAALVLALSSTAFYWGITALNRDTPARPPFPQEITLERPDAALWSVSSDAGRPVVLNFWASWCPPCRSEMPMIDSLARDGNFSDARFYAVNAASTEKSEDSGLLWMEENAFTIPLLFDRSGAASEGLGISSLPTTLVLDASGRIVASKTGAVNRSWIKSALRKARRRNSE